MNDTFDPPDENVDDLPPGPPTADVRNRHLPPVEHAGEGPPIPGRQDEPRVLDAAGYLEGMVDAGGAGDTVSCGFPSLDALLGGGLRRGDLVVLGGDVGCGKSSLAMAMALRAALAGCGVALFSGELSAERLLERALAIQGRARLDDLRHGRLDEFAYAAVAAAALAMRANHPLLSHVPPTGLPGMSDLLIEHLGLDLLVIDPLQSLARGALPMHEELAQAIRALKAMAVRRHCAIVVVAHLDAAVRERADARPRLDDFGALGSVRHLADVVLGLYREELYETSRDVDGAAELHLLKHRGGATGYADLYFYKQWLRFEDMVEPDR